VNREPRLNPDGVSVEGCKIIYAPAGQAGEYAPLATTPYRGCGHKCRYCYVPSVIWMSREEFDAGAVDRKDYVKGFLRDVRKYRRLGVTAQVMLCFTSDPYHPGDNRLTRWTIQNLVEHGLAFCTLTKGGSRALRDMDQFRPDSDSFASSLTLLDEKASAIWEAGAAPPADRIETLKRFHEAGIFTWVSLEPVIEPDQTLEIIRRTRGFVDLYKVGRMNYNSHGRKTDWRRFTEEAVELFARTGSQHYFKEDLQPYLPPGYPNEMRREQRRAA